MLPQAGSAESCCMTGLSTACLSSIQSNPTAPTSQGPMSDPAHVNNLQPPKKERLPCSHSPSPGSGPARSSVPRRGGQPGARARQVRACWVIWSPSSWKARTSSHPLQMDLREPEGVPSCSAPARHPGSAESPGTVKGTPELRQTCLEIKHFNFIHGSSTSHVCVCV